MKFSVIIPTYNRAEILRETLGSMCCLRRDGLSVEFVIVDNNSSDATREVIDSFADRLTIRYVWAPVPGKSRALNRSLEEGNLGDIVVFTDDDVSPEEDWLHQIVAASARWPETSVFGGRIRVRWPRGRVPKWAEDPLIRRFGFTWHEPAEEEGVYEDGMLPYGPNFWVRADVFEHGRRFLETIGPHPTKRTLGDETLFHHQLRADGYSPVYAAKAVVWHRVQPEVLTPKGIRRRAWQLGRGLPYDWGMPDASNLERRPVLWRMNRCLAVVGYATLSAGSMLLPSENLRVRFGVRVIRRLSWHLESLRLARTQRVDS